VSSPSTSGEREGALDASFAGLPPLVESALHRVALLLHQLTEDASLPRNIRRGAQGALTELTRRGVAVDMKVAGTVGLLDELANDVNLPQHGRTAIWGIISQLESLR
jgi:uncharacterized protein (UPF0147 family)